MATETSVSQNIPSILIVDDTPANLELLSGMLRERGYEPRPVPSGKLALLAARADPPDLILLDVRMSEMDGFEVCKRLKADEALKDIPVIFLSALSETDAKQMAFSLGAVDYVTKPFRVEEVEARVRTHLNIRILQRQLRAQNENLEQVVAERTRELANAYKQLMEFSRVQDDFLHMISYEIRTPANGVLGIGELIIDLCPPSKDAALYTELFHESSLRLRNLIEDATLIADLSKLPLKHGPAILFSDLLEEVRASLKNILILMDQQELLDSFLILGNRCLLKRALETFFLLGVSFTKDRHRIHLSGVVEAGSLRLRLDLDALSLSETLADSFFKIESHTRAVSPAETLGLAPIVAHRILSTLGGQMNLVKGAGESGYLEAVFIQERSHA